MEKAKVPFQLQEKHQMKTCTRNVQKRTKKAKYTCNKCYSWRYKRRLCCTNCFYNSKDWKRRDEITKNLNAGVSVDHVASMKVTMNLPWYKLCEIKRWLKTFNVHLASKKNTRKTIEEWVGEGILAELAPLTKTYVVSKQIEITLRPWVYLQFNCSYSKAVDRVERTNLFVHYAFIPDNEMHIKIGGDHGVKF